MASSISLLPEELRKREEEEKNLAQKNKKIPNFKVHLPEDDRFFVEEKKEIKTPRASVSFGYEESLPKANFIAKKKTESTKATDVPVIIEKKIKVVEPVTKEYVLKNINNQKSKPNVFNVGESLSPKQKETPNLLTEDYYTGIKRKFWRIFRNWSILFLLTAVIGVAVYVYFYQKRSEKQAIIIDFDQKIVEVKQKISLYDTSKDLLKDLEKKISAISDLQNGRIRWTVFLDHLERNISKGVYYTDLTADESGKVLLTARTKSYADVARQLEILENADFVEKVEINSASQEEIKNLGTKESVDVLYPIRFQINLFLQKDILN